MSKKPTKSKRKAPVQAVAYLRVSGKGQIDGDGFPRQRSAIVRYGKRHGVQIVREFRDEGVSGSVEGVDRPGLSDLIEFILGDGVRTVLVEHSDRLARDLIVGEIIYRTFREHGVRVIAAASGIDLTADDDDTKKLIRQVLGSVAEFEKSTLVRKLRVSRDRLSRKRGGRIEGRKPFGTRPGETEILKRIRALRRKRKGTGRMSFQRIADTLNDEALPTRQGGLWAAATIRGILTR